MSSLTKIFIVLQLVFSLALSVLVIMVVSSSPKYKDQVEALSKSLVAAQASAVRDADQAARAQLALANLQAERNGDVAQYKAQNTLLAENIARLEKENREITSKNALESGVNAKNAALIASFKDQYAKAFAELDRVRGLLMIAEKKAGELNVTNSTLTQERDQLAKALRRAQEELVTIAMQLDAAKAAPGGAGGAAAGSGSAALAVERAAIAPVNGPISRVDTRNGKVFFSVPLGQRDGVQKGTTVVVSRNNSYIGDAVVETTSVDESVASMKVIVRGKTVQAGDIVTIDR